MVNDMEVLLNVARVGNCIACFFSLIGLIYTLYTILKSKSKKGNSEEEDYLLGFAEYLFFQAFTLMMVALFVTIDPYSFSFILSMINSAIVFLIFMITCFDSYRTYKSEKKK